MRVAPAMSHSPIANWSIYIPALRMLTSLGLSVRTTRGVSIIAVTTTQTIGNAGYLWQAPGVTPTNMWIVADAEL